MTTLSAQRMPLALGSCAAVLIVSSLAVIGASATDARAILMFWLVLAGLVAFCVCALKGSLLPAIMGWFVSLIALHEEFWRLPMPPFFALTVPRIGIVVVVLLFGAMLLTGRMRLRRSRPVGMLMCALGSYLLLSAFFSGFETRSLVSIHYRLIGGYLFPFVVFALMLHAFRDEMDFRRLSIMMAALSVYLAFTGWCERLEIHSLIFPSFISDPEVGIHFGRVRGPFVLAPAMGLAMCYCFFNNLVLSRHCDLPGRWLLRLINAAMLPPLFWTYTRSVWMSFVLCLLIWTLYSQRRINRVVTVSLLLAAMLLITVINMENFRSDDRSRGGLTDTEPILLRIGLAQMTWEIAGDHPLFGLGFGHFRDHAPSYARDPSSPYFAFGSAALEHNNLMSILAETGLVGLVLYVWLLASLIRHSLRVYRRLPVISTGPLDRDLIVLYWILAGAYFVDGTFRETSDNPFANCLFFGFSAIPIAAQYLLPGSKRIHQTLQIGGGVGA